MSTGIRIGRKGSPDTDILFDDLRNEFEFRRDGSLQKTAHDAITVGSINPSTAQIDSVFEVSSSGYVIAGEIEAERFILVSESTQDVSGDFQIRDEVIGDLFTLDDGNSPQLSARYEGDGAFTFGSRKDGNTVGSDSFVMGNNTTASGDSSTAMGDGTTASGFYSTVMGRKTISRMYGGVAQGLWNEDYIGSGNEPATISNITASDRVLAVGVGDDPSATSGDGDYYDGRGRVDGLYVTMRDGTHVRHGLSVDGYNASLGQYETVFEINEAGDIVEGNIDVSNVDVTAAGTDTQVQYNDGGSFGANSDFTWDGTNLTVNGKYQLTDSTGTYDAVAFDTSVPNYYSGSVADIASQSTELYVGASDPSTIDSSKIGSQNYIIGSKVLQGVDLTEADTSLKFAHVEGNFALGSSTLKSEPESIHLSGFAAGFGSTLAHTESGVFSGNFVSITGVGQSVVRNASLTEAARTSAFGSQSLRGASGSVAALTAVGYASGFGSEDVRDSVLIGSNTGEGVSDVLGSFFLGSFAGTTDTDTAGSAYPQPNGIRGSIVIANTGIASKDNQFVAGAAPEQNPLLNPEISEVVFGRGPFADNPASVTITTTNVRSEPASVGVNGDKSGGDMVISSGKGTGSGTPSTISFETPTTTTNTYNQQSLVERVVIDETGVNVNNGDIEVTEPGSGTILNSPDGTRFRVHVENDGTIVSTELP